MGVRFCSTNFGREKWQADVAEDLGEREILYGGKKGGRGGNTRESTLSVALSRSLTPHTHASHFWGTMMRGQNNLDLRSKPVAR